MKAEASRSGVTARRTYLVVAIDRFLARLRPASVRTFLAPIFEGSRGMRWEPGRRAWDRQR